jgi:hypothetical protein
MDEVEDVGWRYHLALRQDPYLYFMMQDIPQEKSFRQLDYKMVYHQIHLIFER